MVTRMATEHEIVVVVGGGAAAIAMAASLLAREPGTDIAIIEPATIQYYQSGWSTVGAGIFRPSDTAHKMTSVMPRKLAPSFPARLIGGTRPSRLAWLPKKSIPPRLYWDAMLKEREWMARPA